MEKTVERVDLVIKDLRKDVATAFSEYANQKAKGDQSVAFEQLLSHSSFLYLFSTFAEKIDTLGERVTLIEDRNTKVIRTMKGTIIKRRD